MSTNEEFSSTTQALALLDLLASDFGQSSPDIALEAIRVELDAAYQRGRDRETTTASPKNHEESSTPSTGWLLYRAQDLIQRGYDASANSIEGHSRDCGLFNGKACSCPLGKWLADASSWMADARSHELRSYPVDITYNVVAYDSGWNGYGINESREGFQSETEALGYVQTLNNHLRQRAVIMKQEKPVVPPTRNTQVWPKQEKAAGPHTCHWCKKRFSVPGDALAHEDTCSQNPFVKTADEL